MASLLLMVVAVAGHSFTRLAEANHWNVHTYQVLLETQALDKSLDKMETGARGYALLGDQVFFRVWTEGRAGFDAHFSNALALTVDRPLQQQHLHQLQAQRQAWTQASIAPLLALRRGAMATAPTTVVTIKQVHRIVASSQPALLSMHAVLAAMTRTESVLLRQRAQEETARRGWTALILLSGGGFSILLMVALAGLLTANTQQLYQANAKLEAEITERKAAEATLEAVAGQLEAAHQDHQRIMAYSLDVICTIDAAGRFLQVSRACENVWGYTSAELIGRPYIELVSPEDVPQTNQAALAIVAGQATANFENRYLRKDGVAVPIIWSAVWSEADKIMFCIARDNSERKRAEAAQLQAAAALSASERRFAAFMDNSPTIAFIKDEAGRYLYANQPYLRHFKLQLGDIIDKTDSDLWPPETARSLRDLDLTVLTGEATLSAIESVPGVDGQSEFWLSYKFPLQDDGRRLLAGMAVDVTANKRAEAALQTSEEQLRSSETALRQVLMQARCILWQATIAGHGEDFRWGPVQVEDEGAAQQVLPLVVPPGQDYRTAWVASWHPEDVERIHRAALTALRTGQPSYAQEYRCFDRTGQVRWILEDVALRQTGPGQWSAVGFCTDVTERKGYEQRIAAQALELHEANVKLESLAITDALTGISNRRAFEVGLQRELQRAVRHRQPLSLLLLDVDNFKAYNDSFGHPAGDEVLQAMGQLLHHQARATDLVSRYGGEEFTVLLPDTDSASAIILAERLRAAIEAAPWPRRALTASVGAATLLSETMEGAALLAAADVALYHSKQNGRNRVTHSADVVHDSH